MRESTALPWPRGIPGDDDLRRARKLPQPSLLPAIEAARPSALADSFVVRALNGPAFARSERSLDAFYTDPANLTKACIDIPFARAGFNTVARSVSVQPIMRHDLRKIARHRLSYIFIEVIMLPPRILPPVPVLLSVVCSISNLSRRPCETNRPARRTLGMMECLSASLLRDHRSAFCSPA